MNLLIITKDMVKMKENMKSALITNSGINKVSGGGIVSLNLLEVLHSVSNVELILSNQHFPDGRYRMGEYKIYAQCLDPRQFGYDDPFFYDYFANSMMQDKDFDLVITYGCPFGETVRNIKKDTFSKVICDLAPHNIQISQEEHLRHPPHQYPYPHLTNQYLLNLYLRQLRLADKVIVHSHSSAEYIMKEAKLTEKPMVIPHGCYLPSEIPEHPADFMPGYFGSLGKDKGIIYLINAIISCNNDKKRMELTIGGREAAGFNMGEYQSYFHVLGEVELPEFYKQISVYVQPSVIEGFGITPLEAMAYYRPVIVSEGAGMSELITEGKDGFFVKRRDSETIAKCLQYFKDNPSEIYRMGREARKTAEKYTWDKIKKQYVEVANAVCSIS
jgi:glycosyltransferase involved in cell wall biosynthesis